jgi:hypothetical protein
MPPPADHPTQSRRKDPWTEGELIDKILAWQQQFGMAPARTDWDPSRARRELPTQEAAARPGWICRLRRVRALRPFNALQGTRTLTRLWCLSCGRRDEDRWSCRRDGPRVALAAPRPAQARLVVRASVKLTLQ